MVLKLFGVITPRQCYDRSSLPLIPFPFSYVKLKEKILECLVLVRFICKKIILLYEIKNLDLDNVPLAKNLNQNTVAFITNWN